MDAPRRFRLLFVLPFAPRLTGTHGGAKVTGSVIAGLAQRHDVAVLHLALPGGPAADRELVAACEVVEPVERGERSLTLRARLALRLSPLRGVPIWAAETAEPRFGQRLADLAAMWRPDVIQLEYPIMGQYLEALEECPAPRVLVEHDARAPGLRTWPGPLGGLTRALDRLAWARFERRVISGVDMVVAFTAADHAVLVDLAREKPVVEVPIGVSPPAAALDPVGSPPPSVLFVGNFTHAPNRDAALWLAESVFPRVRAARSDAQLVIVGPEPPPEVRALADEAIEIAGEVPDVAPYLDAAAVVAAPIRVGGGMRVKVLEALAAGKAVVATPLAVEGLDVVSGDQLLIASSADEFHGALMRLLGDETARRRYGVRAREWARDNLGWDRTIARYEELYRELLAGGRDSG